MDCEKAISELMQAIDSDEKTLSAETRAHLRECVRCSSILLGLSEQVLPPEPPVEPSAAAAENALWAERRKMFVRKIITIGASILLVPVVLVTIGLVAEAKDGGLGISCTEVVFVYLGAVAMATFLAAPVIGALMLFSSPRKGGRAPFYRRLGPGRWLQGVCLGIAEQTGWHVAYVRLAFMLAAVFSKGYAVLVYLIFSAAMPVHPADRRFLLRFKIARLWRRMRGHEVEQHV